MIDTWMNMWTKGPETVVTGWTAMQDAIPSVTDGDMPMWLTSMATPVMAPAMMGVVAANTAAATWAGFWMSAPQASAAAFQALTGGVATAPAKKATPKAAPKPTQAKAAVIKPAVVKPAVVSASPKAAAKPAAKAEVKPTAKAVAKPATRNAAAPKTTLAVTATPKAAPKVDDRPAGLDAPKAGKADDLKRISGVGPKLESVLNDLGIYHFDQIAAWTKKESEWVDTYLRFKGRIARDGWIAQAKTFAKEAV